MSSEINVHNVNVILCGPSYQLGAIDLIDIHANDFQLIAAQIVICYPFNNGTIA